MADRPKLYQRWVNIKQRCFNKKSVDYKWYGARGITVCDKWLTYKGFIEDMGSGFQDGLKIDRIDNNKGYYKENCRWVTDKVQANNTRNIERALRFTFNGITLTIKQWAEKIGIKRSTLHMRLCQYNWPVQRALGGNI